jgi:hypothetical protein
VSELIGAGTQRILAWVMIGLGVATWVSLRFVVAPYGRHTRSGWGPTIPDRLGWLLMESPSSIGWALVFLTGGHAHEPARLALAGLWLFHYVHRTFIYPLRLKSEGKRMPLVIALMAFGFNLLNVSVNATWVAYLGDYPSSWLADPRFLAGALVFFVGFAINYDADRRLFALRSGGKGAGGEGRAKPRYAIPQGGLYRFITCPNYFGELVEWCGWALASWSMGGLAFAFYTAANLVPRAVSNHAWYKEKFPEYPPERKIVVPGVF